MQLSSSDISSVKAMIMRGDKQQDIAAHFGVNAGRIAEIKAGQVGAHIQPADFAMIPPLVTQRSGRFIDPNASLEVQIAQLQAFLKNPPQDSRRLKFTPELAEWILQNLNAANRRRRPTDVRRYAGDMGAGRWLLTGDTIKFNRSGMLCDGQHRLTACVRAQANFESFVVFGVDDKAFAILDSGVTRKSGDTFEVAGIKNATTASAAARWMKILLSDKPTDRAKSYENAELLRFYNEEVDGDLFDECVRLAILACKGKRCMAAGSFAALIYLFHQRDAKAAFTFVQEVDKVERSGRKLLEVVEKIAASNMGRVHDVLRNALTIITFNAVLNGRVVKVDQLRWNESKPFPTIA
jgi:hypothetical protein